MICPICGHNKFRVLYEAVSDDPLEEIPPDPAVYNFFCNRCAVLLYASGTHLDWTGTDLTWNEAQQRLNYKPRSATTRPKVKKSSNDIAAALRHLSKDELAAFLRKAIAAADSQES